MDDPTRNCIFRFISCVIVHASTGDGVRRPRPISIDLPDLFLLLICNTLTVLCVSIFLRDGGVLPFNLAVRLHQLPTLPFFIVVLNVFLNQRRVLASYRAQEADRFISIR
jgi:hypothetical protein